MAHLGVCVRSPHATAGWLVVVVCSVAGMAVNGGDAASSRASDMEIVIYASDITQAALTGWWTVAADRSSPDGTKLVTFDVGEDAPSQPSPRPASYVDVGFTAPAATPYHVWLRLKAEKEIARGDAVWVQFSDALLDGRAAYRVGTHEGLLVALLRCAGCGDQGWGWCDTSWWLRQVATVTFAAPGSHVLRIQAAGSGVQIDQVVLSAQRYVAVPPGAPWNDATVVPR